MRISVITISLNQFEFLPQALASVALQDFEDYEHIVLDPGSTDGSREWLQALSDKHVRLVFEPDAGPADALNKGMELAAGEILLYLNSDDELAPNSLSAITRLHRDHPEDFVLGDGWLIDRAGRPIKYVKTDKFSPRRYAFAVGVVLQQATSFKRSVIDTGTRFNVNNKINWDAEFLFSAHGTGSEFRNTRDVLGYFRLHDDSLTVSGRRKDLYDLEEARLRAMGAKGIPSGLITLVSMLARAWKRLRLELWLILRRPEFPGPVEVWGKGTA